MVNPYYFNFIKLMQSVKSSYMGSPGAGFSSEAGSICNILDRKHIGIEDNISVDICNWNFSRWYQIKIVQGCMIHLSLLIRQLTCSKSGIFIDHNRGHYLKIASFLPLIEEEAY